MTKSSHEVETAMAIQACSESLEAITDHFRTLYAELDRLRERNKVAEHLLHTCRMQLRRRESKVKALQTELREAKEKARVERGLRLMLTK